MCIHAFLLFFCQSNDCRYLFTDHYLSITLFFHLYLGRVHTDYIASVFPRQDYIHMVDASSCIMASSIKVFERVKSEDDD